MAAAAAFSGASFSAVAAPCTSNLWSTHLSGGANATCTLLDTTISNATYSTSTSFGANFPADLVTVTNNPGFSFSVGGDTAGTATISFTITAPSSNPITDASLELSANPGTSPTVLETLSNGSSLSTSTSSTSDSTTFAATTSLNVTDTFSVDVSGFQVQFSQTPGIAVPEPSSLALLGIGLPALGLMRRRKRP